MTKKKLKNNRPLSPHLGIYRWQISNSLSILHRLTGVALFVGFILISMWLVFAIYSSFDSVDTDIKFITSKFSKMILFAWTLAFFYHFFNGIRHLFWDAGYGYSLKTMKGSGILVLISTCIATSTCWLIALNLI